MHHKRFYANRTDIDLGMSDKLQAANARFYQTRCPSPTAFDHNNVLCATVNPGEVPTVQAYEALQPDIHITNHRDRRRSLFQRLNRPVTSDLPKFHSAPAVLPPPTQKINTDTSFLLPPTPTTPAPWSTAAMSHTADDTLTATQLRARILSPVICEDWDEFMAGCMKPVAYAPYRYQPAVVSAPTDISSSITSSVPRPTVPSRSVSPEDWLLVDLIDPTSAPELDTTPVLSTPRTSSQWSAGRRFSFDEDALPDHIIVSQNTSPHSSRSNSGKSVPESLRIIARSSFSMANADQDWFARVGR